MMEGGDLLVPKHSWWQGDTAVAGESLSIVNLILR